LKEKEYYLNDLHDEVPKEEATIKVVELYKNEKLIGRFWISLSNKKEKQLRSTEGHKPKYSEEEDEELEHNGKKKCSKCS